jgi:uncharacterized repeat protein (TIGR02543 family)
MLKISVKRFYLFAVLAVYLIILISDFTYSMYTFTAMGQETKEINMQIVYTLTFDSNGGSSCTDQTQVRNDAWGTLCAPTRTGYNFNGWYTKKSGGTQVTSSTLATGNTKVYARWTGKPYTVTFNNNGGNNSTTSKTVNYGSQYGTLPTPTKTGYTFEGWKLNDKVISSGSVVTTNSSHTLVAEYRANVVIVTLNKQGGTSSDTTTVATYDSNLSSVEVPTKEGYTFGGYYSSQNGNGTRYFDENGDGIGTSTFTSATTIYAKWTPITYTITYTLNGGTVSGNPTSYTIESDNITLNNPTKTGYTFTGWTGSNGTTPSTSVTIATGSTGNKSYVANFEANVYKIVLNNQGATSAGTQEVWYQYKTTKTINSTTCYYYTNSTLTSCLSGGYTITKPTKTGATFGGYYTAITGGTQYVNTSGSFTNNIYQKLPSEINSSYTDTITLYARWGKSVNNLTITLSETSYEYSGNANTPGVTVKDGDVTLVEGTDYTVSYSDNTEVGTGHVTISMTGTYNSTTATSYAGDKTIDFTITKKTITPTASCSNKTYDGTTTASCTLGATGLVGTETVSITGSCAFANKNVGTSKTVTCSSLAIASGTYSGNYTLSATSKTATANITAKSLTPSVSSCSNKTYDGTTSASCTISLATPISGDTVSASGTCTFNNKNVGTGKTVTCSSISLSGTDSGNYTLDSTSKTKTANITARAVTITAKDQTITYGSSIATGTSQVTVGTLGTGDSLTSITLTPSTSNYTTNGTITPSAGVIKNGSTDNTGNYTITYATGVLKINKQTLTPSISSCSNKQYDGTTSATCTISLATPKSGDTVTASGTCTFNSAAVGNSKAVSCTGLTLSGTSASNYTLSTTSVSGGSANITKKTITPTASCSNKTYDGETTASCTLGATGLVGTETVSITGSCAFGDKNVGTSKTVTCSSLAIASGTYSGNYTLSATSKTATANITARTVTITAKDQTITYGSSITTGTSQVTVGTLGTGDSLTSITLTPSTSNYTTNGTITPSAATIKNGTTDNTSNYSITYATGVLKINKVNATCPTLTSYSGQYDGSKHKITVSGGSGGTIQYRTSTSASWSNTNPEAGPDVSTTTVYVQVAGDGNHNTVQCYVSGTTNATVTISKTSATNSVAISGTNRWGNTLTATITTNSDGAKSYQWYYNSNNSTSGGTAISGATNSTYTIASNYVGKYIYVKASVAAGTNWNAASDAYDITDATANTTATVDKKTPTVTTTVSGTTTWGETLTCSATNNGDGTSYTYAWYYTTTSGGTSGTAISGATSSTYTVDKAYVGKYVGCTATVAATTNYKSASAGKATTAVMAKRALSVTRTNYSAAYDGSAHGVTVKVNDSAWDGKTIVSGTSTSYGTTVTSNGSYNTNYTLSPTYTDFTNGAKTVYYKITGGTYYNDYTGTGTVTISKATMATPTVSIDTNGKVTWGNVTGATSYQISFDNSNWTTATSGSEYIDLTSSGTKTAYVRAVSTSTNYNTPSSAGSKSVAVYQLTLTKGTGISAVSGAGYYVSGKQVSIDATVSSGYTWSTWTKNSGTEPASLTTKATTVTIAANTQLTASAVGINYTVRYNQGNNSTTAGSTAFSTTSSHTYGTAKALTTYATLGGTAPSGWTFAGWSTSQTGTSVTYTDGQSVSNLTTTSGATIDLYAIFKRTINVYSGLAKATNNSKEQRYNPYKTTEYITSISLATPTAISGWTALGYRDDTDANASEYGSTASVTPAYNASANYYAVYGKSCDATFYSGVNKATSTTKTSEQAYYNTNTASANLPSTVTFITETEANAASISSWTKAGWRDDTTVGSLEYNYGDLASAACGSNFYSVYTRDLTISYNGNGSTSGSTASQTDEQQYNSGGTSVSTSTFNLSNSGFTKTGSTFSKWAEGSTSGTQYDPGDTYSFAPAVGTTTVTKTMYAIWTVDEYPVSFNRNCPTGGSGGQTDSVNATYGNAMPTISTTAPTCAGYTFKGWYDNQTYSSGTQYYTAAGASARTYNKTTGTTLYGGWDPTTYTVSFNVNGGSGGQSANVSATYGSAMPTISTTKPTRTGFTFMGWYDNATYTSGTQYYTAAGASARSFDKTSATTLYAGWKDAQAPACRLDVINNTTKAVQSASRTDNVGVTAHGMSTSSTPVYNSTTSLTLSANTFYGFVKDAAGNEGQCSKPISSISNTYTCTKAATPLYTCTLTNGATANYSGTITCNKYTCSSGTLSGSICTLTNQSSCSSGWTPTVTGYTCPTVTVNGSTVTPTLSGQTCTYDAYVSQYKCTRSGTPYYSGYCTCDSGDHAYDYRCTSMSCSCQAGYTPNNNCVTLYNCPAPLNTTGQSSSTCTYYISSSENCASGWTRHVRTYACASGNHTLSGSTCSFTASPVYSCSKAATANGTATVQCDTAAKYNSPTTQCGSNVYASNTCTRTYTCSTGSPSGANCVQTNQTSCSSGWTQSSVTGYSCSTGQVNGSNCVLYEQSSCSSGWTSTANPSTCPTGARLSGVDYCVDDVWRVTLDSQSATTNPSPTTFYYVSGTNKYYSNINATTEIASNTLTTLPAKTGYTFGGYYTNTGGSGTQYINTSGAIINNLYNTTPANGRTLYAKWTPLSYTLSISQGAGSTITVNRTSSTGGGSTGNLSNGATIYYGDVLKISITANTGYTIGTHTVNGSAWTSGNNHTVAGNVTVASTATLNSYTVTYNCNGGPGTAPSNATVNHGSNANISNKPCGYIVTAGTSGSIKYQTGWSTSSASGATAMSSVTVTGATDLYATWGNLFTYAGSYNVINDGSGNWRVKFLTTGSKNLVMNASTSVDIFVVGGGGGGGSSGNSSGNCNYVGGGGGGGGYTKTCSNQTASGTISITVGDGGAGSSTAAVASTGGTSSFGSLCSAAGGVGGGYGGATRRKGGAGGNGGSGGGGGASGYYQNSAAGGSNGANGGGNTTSNEDTQGTPGIGCASNNVCKLNTSNCTNTREFCESGGTIYSGGGSGGLGSGSSANSVATVGTPGSPGGGAGGASHAAGSAGTANTGGGGGGAGSHTGEGYDVYASGGKGGSGIVIMRNHR